MTIILNVSHLLYNDVMWEDTDNYLADDRKNLGARIKVPHFLSELRVMRMRVGRLKIQKRRYVSSKYLLFSNRVPKFTCVCLPFELTYSTLLCNSSSYAFFNTGCRIWRETNLRACLHLCRGVINSKSSLSTHCKLDTRTHFENE